MHKDHYHSNMQCNEESNSSFLHIEDISKKFGSNYSYSHITNSTEQSPSWEVNRFSHSQEIHHILWKQRFINTFTTACHLSLTSARSIQSKPTSHFLKCHFNISLHLHLSLPSSLCPSNFPTKTLHIPLLSPTCYMPHSSHSSWHGLNTYIHVLNVWPNFNQVTW